jgi:uncharacterized repeat protein (TIGR01451 family)
VGAGRIDPVNAFSADIIAYNTQRPELVSVSFGVLNVAVPTTFSKNITVRNKGSDTVTYNVTYTPFVRADDDDGGATPGVGNGGAGVTVSVAPAQITLGPGETRTLTVTLAVDPDAMTRPYTHDPTVMEIFPFFYRHWLAEESGYVTLVPTDLNTAVELRVPVYAAPRPSSMMNAATTSIAAPGLSGTTSIDLVGTDVHTGPQHPYDETSLVSAFELSFVSPSRTTGIRAAADLRRVGITSDYQANGNNLAVTQLLFGIETYREWSSLSDTVQFDIYFDLNQDGTAEYRAWNGNITRGFFGFFDSDEFVVFLDDLATSDEADELENFVNFYAPIRSQATPNTVVFQNNVVFLPVQVSQFDYWIASRYKNQPVDLTPVMTYNIETSGIDLSSSATFWGATLYDDWDGTAIDINYDWSQNAGPNPPCILLLHHHNVPGTRAETVCLQSDLVSNLAITKQVSDSTPNPGDTITYLITVTNQAATAAPVVIVEDLLPSGVAYAAHLASQGSYNPNNGQWMVGSLGAGASATLQIDAQVDDHAQGVITNTAIVRAGVGNDLTPGNNTASADIEIGGEDDDAGSGGEAGSFKPVISKEAALAPGALGLPGEQIIWTVMVTNAGTVPGYNFQVMDTIRPELRIDRVETDRGTVSVDQQTITWTVDQLNPAESVQMRIYTTILRTPSDGLFFNEAVVLGPEGPVAATAQVPGVSDLPSTGYPQPHDSQPDRKVIMAGLGLLIGLGGVILAVMRRKIRA